MILRYVIIVLLSAVLVALSSTVTILVTHKPDTSVSDFNSGFQDSKKDDCQQGSIYACQWLRH